MNQELLQRYVEGVVTPDEVKTVVNWLDESDENVREYMALHKLYDITVMNKAAPSQGNVRKFVSWRNVAIEAVKIAAVFCLIWTGMHFFGKRHHEDAQEPLFHTLSVSAGQRAELTLPDSTKVWLNSQSRLVYPAVFEKGKREIQLDGEGFFEVRHNEKQPFIVKTRGLDIQVLGTEFNVIAYASYPATEVALLKGSVALKPVGSNQVYQLKVNENARWRNGKISMSAINNYDYFKWREGLICFDNAAVGTIIEKLELYFDVKIDVQRKQLLDYRYTGKFRTKDGVEQVLRVLQLEHKFTYTRDNEHNVITIK